jgi:two-component system sensor histidine kinase EvgS
MPGINGYQLTQIIRESEEEQQREPGWIIGFTANAMQEITERCLEAGMNSCLFKPCSINSLSAALSSISVSVSPPAPDSQETRNDEVDRQIEATMRSLMITTLREDLDRLATLKVAEHPVEVADLAHRIAGSVRIAGRNDLAEACIRLELNCREQDEKADVLTEQCSTLIAVLTRYLTQLEAGSALNSR